MKLDIVDNTMWKGPIPQKKKEGFTLWHKCTAMVPSECKEALYMSTSKLLKDWHLTLRIISKVKTKNKSKNKNENYSIQYNKFNLKQTLRHDAWCHQPYVTNVHILKSLLLKTLLTSVYAFTHRVLLHLQTSMHPYSTGESDISSSLVPLYQGVPAIPES